jgi:hypothetical protein
MNKLRENFKTKVSINTIGESERFAIQCEQINDDFTIKFLEWLNENSIYYPKEKTYFLTTNGTLKKKFLNILKTMFMENNKNIIRQEEPKQGTMSEAIKQVVNNQLKKNKL